MTASRRDLLRDAAASALAALSDRALLPLLPRGRELRPAPSGATARPAAVEPRDRGICSRGVREPRPWIAGLIIETLPGAEPQLAARLLRVPGIALHGGDGDRRLAAVLEVGDGRSLEDWADDLLAREAQVVAVLPTFIGDETAAK